MIGQINYNCKEVHIVGAGISGLIAAFYLHQEGFKVFLYESSLRAGGLISSRQNQWGLVETAAHSILATEAVQKLCDAVGTKLITVNKSSKARWIWRNNQMQRMPLNIFDLSILFMRIFRKNNVQLESQTIEDWANYHLGVAANHYLVSPFLLGIHASMPSELSMSAAFPHMQVPFGKSLVSQLLQYKKVKGKKTNKPKMMAPVNGMGDLVNSLSRYLEQNLNGRFIKETKINSLPKSENRILCVPAYEAAKIISLEDRACSQSLTQIKYVPLVTATVFVDNKKIAKVPKGVGVLFPPIENCKVLGVLFNSSSYANRVQNISKDSSYTAILGGSLNPNIIDVSDDDIKEIIKNEFASRLNIFEDAIIQIEITKWPKAIPQYSLELEKIWKTIESTWCAKPGNLIFGNYTGQLSIRGMIEFCSQSLVNKNNV